MRTSTIILLLIVLALCVLLWLVSRSVSRERGALLWKLEDAHRQIDEIDAQVKFPTPPLLPTPEERDDYYTKLAAYLRRLDELFHHPVFEEAARTVEQKALGHS